MSLYTTFKTDTELEKSGVLLNYGETREGKPINIRIARAGGANTQYLKKLEAAVKPHRRAIQLDAMDSKQLERILRQVYAEAVVLGWENVEDATGKPIPFNVQNCVKLFEDLPDLYADIQSQAQQVALFRESLREADSGN